MRRSTIAVLAAMFAAPHGLVGQQAASTPTIAVNGEGTVHVDPDRARVRLGVEREAPLARDAQAETNRIANEIMAAMEDLGVAGEDIQTSRLSLYPVYGDPSPDRPRGEPEVTGYRAANTVSITLDDLGRIGAVVDAAIAAGANRVEGVEFELSDATDARGRALAAAVDDARAKAEAIADALGVALGRIVETAEQGVSAPPVPFMARTEAAMVQDVSTPVAAGRVRVTASLTIRYAIDEPDPGP